MNQTKNQMNHSKSKKKQLNSTFCKAKNVNLDNLTKVTPFEKYLQHKNEKTNNIKRKTKPE